jgi:exosortase/archaeosortase family protein
VIREGSQIFDVGRTFQYDVGAACSGIRSLTALFALTTIYAFTSFRTYWKRGLILAAAIPLAVAGNVARITSILVVAQAFGQAAGMKVHDYGEFVFFSVAVICVLMLGLWLGERDERHQARTESATVPAVPGVFLSRQSWAIFVVVLGLVGAAGGFLARFRSMQVLGQPGLKLAGQSISDEKGQVIGTNSVFLPERVLDYQSTNLPVTRVEFEWLPRDTTYGRREYRAPDGFRALLSVVLMGSDRTSIHKPEYCVAGQGWVIRQRQETVITVDRPHPYALPVMKLTLSGQMRGGDGKPLALSGVYAYWFVDDRQVTADHKQRMWWLARDLVQTGVLQRWAYVTCFAICWPGQEDATFDRMQRFITAAVPEFQLTAGPRLDRARESAVGSQ